MRGVSPSLRRSRIVVIAIGLVFAGFVVAGCGSSGATPQGLTGEQASGIADQQYTAEDHQAATLLAPAPGTFLAGKTTVTPLGSTTPANGDVNPYAIWPVTRAVGTLAVGDVLVDNFNNKSNNQGTGTTIVDVHPNGQVSVFASLPAAVPGCPGGVGLTTAMVQLRNGWIIVGSLPSTDGKIDTAGAGCLLELSPAGQLGGTISGPYLDGPWDETVLDNGGSATLFVTNTLVGVARTGAAQVNRGTVVRLALTEPPDVAPRLTGNTQIGGSLPERADAGAFVKGPTGLVLAPSGTLYVADNLGNRIAAIPNALTRTDSAGAGTTLSAGGQLSNPLGLVLAPNGNLLAANATNGKVVEITPAGQQVGEYYAIQDVGQDPPGNGDLFDVAINQAGTGLLFVKDDTNTLALLH
jgi:hypothetical protein